MPTKNKVVGVITVVLFVFQIISVATVRRSKLGVLPSVDSHISRKVTNEFPYPLECHENDLVQYLLDRGISPNEDESDVGNHVKIVMVYHVGMLNNWEEIVRDQMTTLEKCGLGKIATRLMLSYTNGELNKLLDVLEEYDVPLVKDNRVTFIQSTKPPYESAAINHILDYCQRQHRPESTVVFYFYNKDVFRWTEDWKDRMGESSSYVYSLYWRKYMEYFLIERPQLCLDQLLFQGKKTCGIMWRSNPSDHKLDHYNGNFWSATCDYIAQTRKPISDQKPIEWWSTYVAAEFWVGGDDAKNHNSDSNPDELHASLSNTMVNPNSVLMLPEGYRFPSNDFSHLLGVEAKEKLVFPSD